MARLVGIVGAVRCPAAGRPGRASYKVGRVRLPAPVHQRQPCAPGRRPHRLVQLLDPVPLLAGLGGPAAVALDRQVHVGVPEPGGDHGDGDARPGSPVPQPDALRRPVWRRGWRWHTGRGVPHNGAGGDTACLVVVVGRREPEARQRGGGQGHEVGQVPSSVRCVPRPAPCAGYRPPSTTANRAPLATASTGLSNFLIQSHCSRASADQRPYRLTVRFTSVCPSQAETTAMGMPGRGHPCPNQTPSDAPSGAAVGAGTRAEACHTTAQGATRRVWWWSSVVGNRRRVSVEGDRGMKSGRCRPACDACRVRRPVLATGPHQPPPTVRLWPPRPPACPTS